MNPSPKRSHSAIVFWIAVTSGWVGLASAALFGPSVVNAMYQGRSFGPLNRVIQGQSEHRVEVYLRSFDELLSGVFVVVLLATAVGCALETVRRIRSGTWSPVAGIAGFVATTATLLLFGTLLGSSPLLQIGAVIGVLLAASAVAALLGRDPVAPAKAFLAAVAFGLLFFATGEAFLRGMFPEGEAFRTHLGPIVGRFERDFVFNRYDGPSRGPEIVVGRKPGQIRLLLQGDSITWGMGVRSEDDLFSGLLRDSLRAEGHDLELAVLAKPGREIDGHVRQLKKWGARIDPDLIVYQWYANDVELDKSKRPRGKGRFWRHFFAHRFLVSHSYLWFFLDFNLEGLLPDPPQTYTEYMSDEYAFGSEAWLEFEALFEEWLREARRLTPHVLVVTFPHINPDGERIVVDVFESLSALCRKHDVEMLDLWEPLRPLAEHDPAQITASPYDGHPSELAHRSVAEALHERVTTHAPLTLERSGSR